MQKAPGRGSIQKVRVSLEVHPGPEKTLLGDWTASSSAVPQGQKAIKSLDRVILWELVL